MTDLARNPKQIGNLVRRARKQRGLTQTQLGEKAGLRQATISMIETGNPATTLKTMLAVLGVPDHGIIMDILGALKSTFSHELGHMLSFKHTFEPYVGLKKNCNRGYPKGESGKRGTGPEGELLSWITTGKTLIPLSE